MYNRDKIAYFHKKVSSASGRLWAKTPKQVTLVRYMSLLQ